MKIRSETFYYTVSKNISIDLQHSIKRIFFVMRIRLLPLTFPVYPYMMSSCQNSQHTPKQKVALFILPIFYTQLVLRETMSLGIKLNQCLLPIPN